MKASEEFIAFCERFGGTPSKRNTVFVCNMKQEHGELTDITEIDIEDKQLMMWNKSGKHATLRVPDRLVMSPSGINYKVGDWVLDSGGGTLNGIFKISRIEAETNTFDDMLKIRLRDD